jgi:hypothetical protein
MKLPSHVNSLAAKRNEHTGRIGIQLTVLPVPDQERIDAQFVPEWNLVFPLVFPELQTINLHLHFVGESEFYLVDSGFIPLAGF